MNDTIETLKKTIKTYKDREIGYHETIERLSGDNINIVVGMARLKMRTDRLHRDHVDMKRDIRELQAAILDMAKTQIANTESRKKFEAGYYGGIGE